MTDKTKAPHLPSVKNRDEALALQSQGVEQLRQRVVDLLTQADQETELVKTRIADLLAQVGELREVAKSKNALEDLVLKLRDANHNLIIATFGAQDMQATAEAVNHRQEEFLAMLAHELRNPLAPIMMATELMGKITSAHPQLPKLHSIIYRQANHLTHLVDDLVDASRVSSGKITLQKSTIKLAEIIESAVETSQPFIDKRNQRLVIKMLEEPIAIDGDLVRLAQVFSNLLINATKFMPEGGKIVLSVHRVANAVVVSVKDNGVGIAADIQPFIFDLFRQGPHSLDRSQGGLGIGLSLVRTIVEMHSGTVKVRSAGAGFGSEFIVMLPVSGAALPGDARTVPSVIPVRSRRILVIEDNADVNETLSDFLTLEGHVTTSAFDGISGIAMAKENAYDVIVCDIGLPGMDGYEVIKQLRLLSPKPVPCYIALTGYNYHQNRNRALEAGFDHYLVKPIAVDILVNLISSSVAQ
ncbi:hybrid sensor histidine kinase/response regulator [Undibacterium sp.]|uniref:hybrid sensor histidine kinase/response regulator n=1 Tax=Undibacterium sp. TaxID=1914977 RepID=UPI002BB69095|nr:hybrid sensor histidine kinase/response regulator [Undibacterium sp.]HTD04729.1 hybrid sensor histidine kinase/response regulator [Undibacterium sp.]